MKSATARFIMVIVFVPPLSFYRTSPDPLSPGQHLYWRQHIWNVSGRDFPTAAGAAFSSLIILVTVMVVLPLMCPRYSIAVAFSTAEYHSPLSGRPYNLNKRAQSCQKLPHLLGLPVVSRD